MSRSSEDMTCFGDLLRTWNFRQTLLTPQLVATTTPTQARKKKTKKHKKLKPLKTIKKQQNTDIVNVNANMLLSRGLVR